MKRVLGPASVVSATSVLVFMMAQASGCGRSGAAPVAVPSFEPAAPPSAMPYDDDLSGYFFMGTKCASIRVRQWLTGPPSPVAPPAMSVEKAEVEVP